MDSGLEVLSEEQAALKEGIGLILSRWPVMLLAVENGWGGRNSHAKAERTVSNVFDYFTQLKYRIDRNRLVKILEEGLGELNTVADDGSLDEGNPEDVVDKLLDLCEECFDGNYQTVEKLRATNSQTRVSAVKVSNGNDEEDDESDDEDEDTSMDNDQTTDMMVDDVDHCSNWKLEAMPVDQPKADDGWTVVPCRKNKGKRN